MIFLSDADGNMVEEHCYEKNHHSCIYYNEGTPTESVATNFYFGEITKSIKRYEFIGQTPRIVSKTTYKHPNDSWMIRDDFTKIELDVVKSLQNEKFQIVRSERSYFYENDLCFFPSNISVKVGNESYKEEYLYSDIELDLEDDDLQRTDNIRFAIEFQELDFFSYQYDPDAMMPEQVKIIKSVDILFNSQIIEKKEILQGDGEYEVLCHIFNGSEFELHSKHLYFENTSSSIDFYEQPYNKSYFEKSIVFSDSREDYREDFQENGELDLVDTPNYNLALREHLISRKCNKIENVKFERDSTLEDNSGVKSYGQETSFSYDTSGRVLNETIKTINNFHQQFIDEDTGEQVWIYREINPTKTMYFSYFPNGMLKSMSMKKDDIDCFYVEYSSDSTNQFCIPIEKKLYDSLGRIVFHQFKNGNKETTLYVSSDDGAFISVIKTIYGQNGFVGITTKSYGQNKSFEVQIELDNLNANSSVREVNLRDENEVLINNINEQEFTL